MIILRVFGHLGALGECVGAATAIAAPFIFKLTLIILI